MRNHLAELAIQSAQRKDFCRTAPNQSVLEHPFTATGQGTLRRLAPDWAQSLTISLQFLMTRFLEPSMTYPIENHRKSGNPLKAKGAEPTGLRRDAPGCHRAPPFTGLYASHFRDGVYHCVCCDQPLFRSGRRNSGCGWPSFDQAIAEGCAAGPCDRSYGVWSNRTEALCSQMRRNIGTWGICLTTGLRNTGFARYQ